MEKPKAQTRRLYRSTTDRQVAGVCGGLAHYMGVDASLIRLLFLVMLFMGEGFFVYIILWLILPEGPSQAYELPHGTKIYRSRYQRVIVGVCGGIAEYFNVDVTLVRLIFLLAAATGGTGILMYLILAVVLPEPPAGYDPLAEKAKRAL